MTFDTSKHGDAWHRMVQPDADPLDRNLPNSRVTVTLEPEGGKTRMTIHMAFKTAKAIRDAMARIGMAEGWTSSFEKMDELLVVRRPNFDPLKHYLLQKHQTQSFLHEDYDHGCEQIQRDPNQPRLRRPGEGRVGRMDRSQAGGAMVGAARVHNHDAQQGSSARRTLELHDARAGRDGLSEYDEIL